MSDRLTKEQLEARGLVLAGMVDQEATIAALRAELEKARALLKDLAEWNDWHDELPEDFCARLAKEFLQ